MKNKSTFHQKLTVVNSVLIAILACMQIGQIVFPDRMLKRLNECKVREMEYGDDPEIKLDSCSFNQQENPSINVAFTTGKGKIAYVLETSIFVPDRNAGYKRFLISHFPGIPIKFSHEYPLRVDIGRVSELTKYSNIPLNDYIFKGVGKDVLPIAMIQKDTDLNRGSIIEYKNLRILVEVKYRSILDDEKLALFDINLYFLNKKLEEPRIMTIK